MKESIKEKIIAGAKTIDIVLTVAYIVYLVIMSAVFLLSLPYTGDFVIVSFMLLVTAINFAFVTAQFMSIRGITKTVIVHQTPFVGDNTKRLRRIGALVIIMSFLPSYHIDFGTSAFTFNFFNFNIASIAAGICVFALSFVFAYGCALQQSDDETL